MKLRDEEIIKILMDYIEDPRYKQTVLIDGEWGSGKTFFVQKKMLKELRSQRPNQKVIYISLYGVSDVSQIINEIYSKLVENVIEKKAGEEKAKIATKGIDIVSKLFSAGIKYFNIEANDLPNLSDIISIGESILIFDDLERCEIDVNQTLGFINNLVEHNEIKVILVANQAEIGRMSLSKDLSLKYLLALDKRIKIDSENDTNNVGKKEKNNIQNEEYTKQQLIKRTNALFTEDILYEKIKEKLIGLTIYYQANFNNIFMDVVEGYTKSGKAQTYLLSKKQIIVNLFEENKHHNIRTLIFGIIAFEKLFYVLDSISFEPTEYIEEHKLLVLKYVMELAIRIKSGKEVYAWQNSASKSGKIHFGKNFWENPIYGYKFVDDYLLHRYFDEEGIRSIIERLASEKKKGEESRNQELELSYNKLSKWWELEDDEINSYLQILKGELEEEKYTPRYFRDIILILMQIEHQGFIIIDYNDFIKYMVSLIEKAEPFGRKIMELLAQDSDMVTKYNKIAKPLFEIIDNKEKTQKRENNSFLDSREYWNDDFYQKCLDNENEYIRDKRFLFYIEPSKMIEQIKVAKTREIYMLLEGIKAIYSFSNLNEYFKADISNITEILQAMDREDLSNGKKTKEIALSKLKEKLEKSLKLIKA